MRQHVAQAETGRTRASVSRAPDPAVVAEARLRASAYLALRALTCDSHEGVLAIRGQVSSFYLKQLAQAAVRDVPGVDVIHNQVQVAPSEGEPHQVTRGS